MKKSPTNKATIRVQNLVAFLFGSARNTQVFSVQNGKRVPIRSLKQKGKTIELA